ncbi:hypothetical protein ACFOPN_12660 [Xanthomonas hyacinthi]|uniref:Uncharacterized protein n=1 Tax=Xanthomonas hyacinthi TaxID=56455 RepID=A0A2S7EPG7_9XANT|nr:hypothetical protein Y886_29455 [Xanthomonas hyacinthi DSM 19077]PPU94418.1 hypothetical protein XhyaCFBP1156_20095 [Xanthomonas hyacinthi]
MVHCQQEIACQTSGAICAGERSPIVDHIAITKVEVCRRCWGQIDGSDTQLVQSKQLSRLGDAVLVQVAPYTDVVEFGILGVEHAVFITVKIC